MVHGPSKTSYKSSRANNNTSSVKVGIPSTVGVSSAVRAITKKTQQSLVKANTTTAVPVNKSTTKTTTTKSSNNMIFTKH